MMWKNPDSPTSSLLDTDELKGKAPTVIKKIGDLIKDGVYDEGTLKIAFNKMCGEDITKFITINTSNTWQFETPAGSIWRIRQVTKKGKRLRSYLDDMGSSIEVGLLDTLKEEIPIDLGSWELSIEAPPVAGSRPSLRVKIEGTRAQALLKLTLPALFSIFLKQTYQEQLNTFSTEFIETFPAAARPFFKEPVDIRGLGPLYSKGLSWTVTPETASKVSTSFNLSIKQLHFITVLLLHESCIYNNRKTVEEGEEMAKKNAGMVWWLITGGSSSIGKVTNALTKDRHFIVLDSPTSIYLRIQKNENTFANGIVRTTNCKLVPSEVPKYEDTLCGKRHTDAGSHSRRCSGCARVKDNLNRAEETAAVKEAELVTSRAIVTGRVAPSTSSPDGKFTSGEGTTWPINPITPPRVQTRKEEEMEWKSKNGAVITIKAPQIELTDDFELAAQEYEEISEWFLTKSTEYAELANKLRTFGQPSQAVQEAEMALAAARQRDEDQRAKDKADIIAAIASSKKGD